MAISEDNLCFESNLDASWQYLQLHPPDWPLLLNIYNFRGLWVLVGLRCRVPELDGVFLVPHVKQPHPEGCNKGLVDSLSLGLGEVHPSKKVLQHVGDVVGNKLWACFHEMEAEEGYQRNTFHLWSLQNTKGG